MEDGGVEPDPLHDLKNHLFVVVAYCRMLLADMPETDPRYPDIKEIEKASRSAVALLPDIANLMT